VTGNAFFELGLIIIIATVIAAILRVLKQPIVISYILTGLLVSPAVFNIVKTTDSLASFAQIGIALLLFIVGIHLNPKVIKEVGFVSLIVGIGQVIFTAGIGFGIATLLGFSVVSSIYIALALAFSSTIIILKLLSDKGDLETLYGKIAVGVLIVQDILAVVALLVINSISGSGGFQFQPLIFMHFFEGLHDAMTYSVAAE